MISLSSIARDRRHAIRQILQKIKVFLVSFFLKKTFKFELVCPGKREFPILIIEESCIGIALIARERKGKGRGRSLGNSKIQKKCSHACAREGKGKGKRYFIFQTAFLSVRPNSKVSRFPLLAYFLFYAPDTFFLPLLFLGIFVFFGNPRAAADTS